MSKNKALDAFAGISVTCTKLGTFTVCWSDNVARNVRVKVPYDRGHDMMPQAYAAAVKYCEGYNRFIVGSFPPNAPFVPAPVRVNTDRSCVSIKDGWIFSVC